MTGIVRPRPVAQFLYTLDLLFGKKGFLTHNPPLLLALVAGVLVLRNGRPLGIEPRPAGSGAYRLELLALVAWCVVGWLMYGVLSKNHGGTCVAIRWFVPFLAPGFWLLARVLAEHPEVRRDFVVLAAWGLPLSASAWLVGPWWPRNVPGYWWVFGASLSTWAVVRVHAWRTQTEPRTLAAPAPVPDAPARAA
jgi:hypothetical protein